MAVKKMLGRVAYKANLAGDTWLVRISLTEVADFVPGQFVSIKVNKEGMRRSYSVASLPGEKMIDLVIDVSPMGIGSKYVLGLKVGDEVEILGFLGKFTIDENDLLVRKQMIFVGTGTGIVPLKPMIEDMLVNKLYRGQTYLIWGMRYEKDLYWMKEVDDLQRDYDNFHFEVVLSRPESDWPGLSGHVGDIVNNLEINWQETGVYLCGNPDMILDIKEKVTKKGVPERQVVYERFA